MPVLYNVFILCTQIRNKESTAYGLSQNCPVDYFAAAGRISSSGIGFSLLAEYFVDAAGLFSRLDSRNLGDCQKIMLARRNDEPPVTHSRRRAF